MYNASVWATKAPSFIGLRLPIHVMTLSLLMVLSSQARSSSITRYEEVFEAVLSKGAILKRLKTTKQLKLQSYITPMKAIVRARFKSRDSDDVIILDKNGKPRYTTHYRHIENIKQVSSLHPQVDPLKIHKKSIAINELDDNNKNYLSHFFSLTNFQGKSDFQPLLLGGTETATSGLLGMVKSYFINPKTPLFFGLNSAFFRGSWKDQTVGSSSSQAFFIGPSLMTQFYKTADSAFNVHFHFFQSLRHQMGQEPAPINLSTNGWQLDLEREFTWLDKPFFFAFNYRLTNSKVKSSQQILSGPTEDTPESQFGLSFGYRLNWNL